MSSAVAPLKSQNPEKEESCTWSSSCLHVVVQLSVFFCLSLFWARGFFGFVLPGARDPYICRDSRPPILVSSRVSFGENSLPSWSAGKLRLGLGLAMKRRSPAADTAWPSFSPRERLLSCPWRDETDGPMLVFRLHDPNFLHGFLRERGALIRLAA